ncbi:hypothetical protein [Streptomyces sp. NPDC018352]|uniref:hypothetical protein n=1 Tax=Streptomyces sp. NPDC018352 TaxID=3157194 RepID=UPI0033C08B7D
MGYVTFREVYARDTGISLEERDERAARALSHTVAVLTTAVRTRTASTETTVELRTSARPA